MDFQPAIQSPELRLITGTITVESIPNGALLRVHEISLRPRDYGARGLHLRELDFASLIRSEHPQAQRYWLSGSENGILEPDVEVGCKKAIHLHCMVQLENDVASTNLSARKQILLGTIRNCLGTL